MKTGRGEKGEKDIIPLGGDNKKNFNIPYFKASI